MTGDNANQAQAAPSLQVEIARERLYRAAALLIDDEIERAALAYAVSVLDAASRASRGTGEG